MMQRLKQLQLYGLFALLAYMPFSLFISRWFSLYTGGLGQWDAAKDIFTLILLVASIAIAYKSGFFANKIIKLLFWLAATYGTLHVLYLVFDAKDQDTRTWVVATLYNGRIFAYLFIALIVGLIYKNPPKKRIAQIILIASTITCLFAFVQFVLPKDLMTHFGYSVERGAKPAFFIDDKPDFPRVMSTIRDPNSYGAYLVLPLTLLWVMFFKNSWSRSRLLLLLFVHGLALLLTFSRGAWLGAAMALFIATIYLERKPFILFWHKHKVLVAGLVVVAFAGGIMMRNSYVFQNVILHSDKSTVMADPNELRVQLQNKAIRDIAEDPEGHGPGTAGLVSIGNPKGTFLTENYYLQIGYELGVLGLVIFLAILALVGVLLVNVRDSEDRVVLLSSFFAYAFISLLIHLWSNEAVAAQWWILAGLLVGTSIRNSHNKNETT